MSEKILFGETFIIIGIATLIGGLVVIMSRIETFLPYLAVALVFTLPVFNFIKNKLMVANGYEVDEKNKLTIIKILKNPITVILLVVTVLTGILEANIVIKTVLFIFVSTMVLNTLQFTINKIKNIEVPSISMPKAKIKMPTFNSSDNLAFGAKKKKGKE